MDYILGIQMCRKIPFVSSEENINNGFAYSHLVMLFSGGPHRHTFKLVVMEETTQHEKYMYENKFTGRRHEAHQTKPVRSSSSRLIRLIHIYMIPPSFSILLLKHFQGRVGCEERPRADSKRKDSLKENQEMNVGVNHDLYTFPPR